MICTVRSKLQYETTCGAVWYVFSSVDEKVESSVKEKLPYEALYAHVVVEKCYEAILTGVICNVCVILCEAIWSDFSLLM